MLILPTFVARRERWWLHISLFLLTFVTVAAGGALLQSGERASGPMSWNLPGLATFVKQWVMGTLPGVNFALALMGILLVHECGHYFLAKRYRINVSPPFFFPAPYQINFIGTFGALIRLRGPVADRRQLMDVGAAGPWAGFILAVLYFVVGLTLSVPSHAANDVGLVINIGTPHLRMGDSLLTYWFRHWRFADAAVLLHPLALAGWFGMFVTALNLLPLGQLDGGHVLYALSGRLQAIISVIVWLALIPLGHFFWGWWLWAGFIFVISRGRVLHPSVLDRHRRLPVSREVLGWATLVLFALTFTPVPIYI